MKIAFDKNEVIARYKVIMGNEIRIRPNHKAKRRFYFFDGCGDVTEAAEEIYNAARRVFEAAQLAFVSRSYNHSYGLCDSEIVYESVAAHTNLMTAIATEALDFHYGNDPNLCSLKNHGKTSDGYSYREVIEAIRLHDLPENVIGDLPDNGSHDEDEKHVHEEKYFTSYFNTYPKRAAALKQNVSELLAGMEEKSTSTGKLLYLSDKLSALIVTLYLDSSGDWPMISADSPYVSDKDRQEIAMCDFSYNHKSKASEMWAIDFFEMRELVKYDDDFFFTALLVMATLIVNGRWYSWREKRY